jgi:hypothetical protein
MKYLVFSFYLFLSCTAICQQDRPDSMDFGFPLINVPENIHPKLSYPSMVGSAEIAESFYQLGYAAVRSGSVALFKGLEKSNLKKTRYIRGAFNYVASLALDRYGSELPIPLGVWAHETFHQSVLNANGAAHSINGNWLFNRWNGEVYGVSDEELSALKSNNLSGLLHAYVAGVQSEVVIGKLSTLKNFYGGPSEFRNALALYNAWHVWNYFRFCTSKGSDDAKHNLPTYEDKNPLQRDFAGADLTAWIYDMFQPHRSYTDRDPFPNGYGVNRRIGFSDLPIEGQKYLIQQKNLALLNFINPSIFFINRIKLNRYSRFNFFVEYSPTPFGNDISLLVPFAIRKNNYLFGFHRYSNSIFSPVGFEGSLVNYPITRGVLLTTRFAIWTQPRTQSYWELERKLGGSLNSCFSYSFLKHFRLGAQLYAKTSGWELSSPYLGNHFSGEISVFYHL